MIVALFEGSLCKRSFTIIYVVCVKRHLAAFYYSLSIEFFLFYTYFCLYPDILKSYVLGIYKSETKICL